MKRGNSVTQPDKSCGMYFAEVYEHLLNHDYGLATSKAVTMVEEITKPGHCKCSKFAPRVCRRLQCGKAFSPKDGRQLYCRKACMQAVVKYRYRESLKKAAQ